MSQEEQPPVRAVTAFLWPPVVCLRISDQPLIHAGSRQRLEQGAPVRSLPDMPWRGLPRDVSKGEHPLPLCSACRRLPLPGPWRLLPPGAAQTRNPTEMGGEDAPSQYHPAQHPNRRHPGRWAGLREAGHVHSCLGPARLSLGPQGPVCDWRCLVRDWSHCLLSCCPRCIPHTRAGGLNRRILEKRKPLHLPRWSLLQKSQREVA